MSKVMFEIENCMDCPDSVVLPDPDPNDWFCDDDKKVVCNLNKAEKCITRACRPYNLRKECDIPTWCPRLGGSPDGN